MPFPIWFEFGYHVVVPSLATSMCTCLNLSYISCPKSSVLVLDLVHGYSICSRQESVLALKLESNFLC